MARVKLPITGDPYKNVDEVSLDTKSVRLIDGYVDEIGSTNRRQGLKSHIDLGTGKSVDGDFWWEDMGIAIAVSNGKVFKVSDEYGTYSDITGSTLEVGKKVVFSAARGSSFEPLLYMASGASLIKYSGSGTTTTVSDADAPTAATHVTYLDRFLIANDNDTTSGASFLYSDVGDPDSWTATSFETPQSKADKIMAIDSGWRNIMVLGTLSAELWYIDDSGTFRRFTQGYMERGTNSPYSLIAADNTWFWLDHTRRFVRVNGTTPEIISTPFDSLIQSFSTVSDCTAELVETGGRPFIVWQFPTAKRTLVYNYALKSWSEWGFWNPAGDNSANEGYEAWLGRSHCYANDWNQHLVGSRWNGSPYGGKIYLMKNTEYQDDGKQLRFTRRTGHINHGTLARKRSNMLIVRLKRGIGNSTVTNPEMDIRWRDENGPWSNDHSVQLGTVGDNVFIVKLYRLGIYRTRQYEFNMGDAADTVLVEAEEDVDILAN